MAIVFVFSCYFVCRFFLLLLFCFSFFSVILFVVFLLLFCLPFVFCLFFSYVISLFVVQVGCRFVEECCRHAGLFVIDAVAFA